MYDVHFWVELSSVTTDVLSSCGAVSVACKPGNDKMLST